MKLLLLLDREVVRLCIVGLAEFMLDRGVMLSGTLSNEECRRPEPTPVVCASSSPNESKFSAVRASGVGRLVSRTVLSCAGSSSAIRGGTAGRRCSRLAGGEESGGLGACYV